MVKQQNAWVVLVMPTADLWVPSKSFSFSAVSSSFEFLHTRVAEAHLRVSCDFECCVCHGTTAARRWSPSARAPKHSLSSSLESHLAAHFYLVWKAAES